MANGLDMDATGFGFRSGSIWRNEGGAGPDGWYWTIGMERTRGPYVSKQAARDAVDIYLRVLERKGQRNG